MIESISFYIFATILVISAFRVITVRNPVHAVLFLVLAFFNATGLFVLLGAELIAMLLAIVYVGAVAVLFLFVVMMLDIDFASLRDKVRSYLPVGLAVGLVLLAELYLIAQNWGRSVLSSKMVENPVPIEEGITNSHALGMIIYTDYVFLFQLAGVVLFVAMIGAIVLTHRTRPGVKRQKPADQIKRSVEETAHMVKVETGKGVS